MKLPLHFAEENRQNPNAWPLEQARREQSCFVESAQCLLGRAADRATSQQQDYPNLPQRTESLLLWKKGERK